MMLSYRPHSFLRSRSDGSHCMHACQFSIPTRDAIKHNTNDNKPHIWYLPRVVTRVCVSNDDNTDRWAKVY